MPKMNTSKVIGAEVAIVREGKVLLVQQRKPSAYGLWSFPGGHVEKGESFEAAVIREVHEELGAKLDVQKLLCKSQLKTESGNNLELHTYVGYIPGEIVLRDSELMAYGWFSLDSLENMKDKLRSPMVLRAASQVL